MLIAVGRVNRRRPLAQERERHREERACRPVRGADKMSEWPAATKVRVSAIFQS